MTNSSILIGVAAIAVLLLGCQHAEDSGEDRIDQPSISADLEPFLNNYFASWSSNDMEAYRSCFHDSATVIHVVRGEVRTAMDLGAFIERQAAYLARVDGPVSERMVSFAADEDPQGSTVVVRWLYEGVGETSTGTDRFTLIRDVDGAWKIAALVWYEDIQ